MLDKKKFLLFLATTALVAACGGGGNSGSTPSTGSGGGDTVGDGGGDGTGGNTPVDQQMAGHLTMVGNQLVYVRTDRSMYLPVELERFEGSNGINDVAPGYTGNEPEAPVYSGADGGNYAPAQTLGPAAPLAAFGIRVNKLVQRSNDTDVISNQTAVGRLAVELVERSDSPAIGSGQPEVVRFVIDNVELSTDANGELSARVLPDSQMHVVGRDAAGTEVTDTVPARTDVVSILPMSRVPDHFGDDTSVVLLFDFEKAFPEEANRLAPLQNVAGFFDMRVTLSPAQMVRPASSNGSLPRKELVGEEITVGDQPPVTGGGLVGKAWIRWYDPNPPADRGYGE